MPDAERSALRARHNSAHPSNDRETLLWSWDLSSVRRRVGVRLGCNSQTAKAIETEYRKFLSLALGDPHTTFGMAGPVDEFWHEHLLDSRDYVKFCADIFGDYVHHIPRSLDGAPDPTSYRVTVEALRRRYGRVNRRVWPDAKFAVSDCNCATCDRGVEPAANAAPH